MLLQTNSYIVPKEKRAAHHHLMQRFRQVLMRIGCDHFEVYEQVGANWTGGETSGRFVQMMRFRDRKHCQAVQQAERNDPAAQALVREFCQLINFDYQEQQGLFAHGYYQATIEPIRLKGPSDLAFHSYVGPETPFDPAAAVQPPPREEQEAAGSGEQSGGPTFSDMARKPAEGESDPAGDEVLGLDDLALEDDASPDADTSVSDPDDVTADTDDGGPDVQQESRQTS